MSGDLKPEPLNIIDDEMYAAAWATFQTIEAPEALSARQLHQFWTFVETHAYYARKSVLRELAGLPAENYLHNHLRKRIVAAGHLSEDERLELRLRVEGSRDG